MTKYIQKISILALFAAAVTIAPVHVYAEDKPAMEQTKPKSVPFHGKVSAVDKTQMTLSVGERVFQVTSETKITKDGKPAILDDAVVGDNVGGAYKKSDDGKMTAATINLGLKPEKPEKPKPAEEPKM